MLDYIYFRMYISYLEKNDSLKLRSFMYMSFFLLVLLSLMLIYLEAVLLKSDLISQVKIDRIKTSTWFWFTLISLILVKTYYLFTKKELEYYEEKFSEENSLLNSIRVWMLVILPFLVLFIGMIIQVFLFGGEIFGEIIEGVLN